ncbi:phage replisome organizer N-terminal domain-containing protein [Enterococcus spodopteracolus]|uniref:phage replisome organizer N-terminal domain-containing protein n=2 Tax=Enterococcus spodopteracolus TaxID=3034501 RepID=UPI002647B744|nr:phage replisome organizer N-terminal domain-containing protein [Enterococcus spodopteracolus]
MADNKRYYYLKLKENFFDSDEMILLESMPDGYIYSNILLKLYLRSLKHEGKLMFNDRIPFNSTMLATITRHSVGVVEKAVQIFCDLQLIDVLDNGAIYMSDIQSFIGKSSTEADRKRDYRKKIEEAKKNLITGGQMSDKCPDKTTPELELEKELDIEKELEKDKDKQDAPELKQYSIQIYSYIEKNGFGSPYGNTMGDNINFWLKDLEEAGLTIEQADAWMIHGVNTAIENNNRRWNYLEGILKNRFNKRLFSKSAIEGEEEMRKSQQVKSISRNYQKNVRREKLPEWANKSQEEKELDPQQKAEIDARFEAYLAQKAQEEKENDC